MGKLTPLNPTFRGSTQTELATAHAIAGIISENELHPEYIVPSVFDKRVAEAVANAVEEAAYQTRVARRDRNAQE